MAFDIDAAVDTATAKSTFDVLDFVRNASLPSESVTIYTNAAAAKELAGLLAAEASRLKAAAAADDYGLSIADEPEDLFDDARATELHDELAASALVFDLRGIAPAAHTALENHLKATFPYREGADNPEYGQALEHNLIAKTITSVRNAAGAVDDTPWTAARVADLVTELYPSETGKLFVAVAEVTYLGNVFDRAVSADF